MVINNIYTNVRLLVVIDDIPLEAWRNKIIDDISDSPIYKIVNILRLSSSLQPMNQLCCLHMHIDQWYFNPKPNAFEQKENTLGVEKKMWMSEKKLSVQFDYLIWLSDQSPSEVFLQQLTKPLLSFVHGPSNIHDGRLLGYQGFYQKREVLSSALICYTTKRFKLIERTWSMMRTMSIARSRNEHFWKLSTLLPRALKKISQLKSKSISIESLVDLSVNSESKPISTLTALRCLYHHGLCFSIKALRKLQYKEQWILLLKMQNGIAKDFNTFKKILPPKDVFWADPFLVEEKDKHYLFFEELPFSTWKGHLSVSEIDEQGNLSKPIKILDLPYHLSYPFIFKFDNQFYMIPESYEAGNIQLFEAISFPYDWQHKMDLMNGVMAFDTTLYFNNGKWWMFTTLAEEGSSHNDELFLFYADSPFTNEWTSHPKNPIVSDVRSARPAGKIYEENGKIIRPSQDCSRKYGYGFHLNEIEILTETDYREKSILHVRPDWEKLFTRTHSFNHSSKATVIDAAIQRSRFF
jgi:hypothetical protein